MLQRVQAQIDVARQLVEPAAELIDGVLQLLDLADELPLLILELIEPHIGAERRGAGIAAAAVLGPRHGQRQKDPRE